MERTVIELTAAKLKRLMDDTLNELPLASAEHISDERFETIINTNSITDNEARHTAHCEDCYSRFKAFEGR